MNNEVKAKWVEALRSGEYEQGEGFLNKRGKFCCLGVLTDLYIKEHGKEWRNDQSQDKSTMAFGDTCSTLPEDVGTWAGLRNNPMGYFGLEGMEGGLPTRDWSVGSLVTCNDGIKLTFPQIADVIQYAF